MPKIIQPTRTRAPDESDLAEQVADLRELVHSLAATMQAQTRVNPTTPAGGDTVLMQLLLDERRRSEEKDAALQQLQNPLHQLDQLQALASLVQPEKEDNSLLTGALEALGGVISASMDASEQSESSGAAAGADAGDGFGEP